MSLYKIQWLLLQVAKRFFCDGDGFSEGGVGGGFFLRKTINRMFP